jgi:hypothetical protein
MNLAHPGGGAPTASALAGSTDISHTVESPPSSQDDHGDCEEIRRPSHSGQDDKSRKTAQTAHDQYARFKRVITYFHYAKTWKHNSLDALLSPTR